MNTQKAVRMLVLFSLLIAAHFFLRPMLQWRVGVDYLVIAVLLVAVRVRPGVAAVVGLVTGVMGDALSPQAFGAGALALSLISFGASWLKAVFFSDNVLLHAVFFFAGKWAFDVVYVIADRQPGGGVFEAVTQLLLWSPLAAAATAAAGLVILMLFKGMLEVSST